MGFINLTKFNQLGTGDWTGDSNTTGSGSASGAGLDSTYLRLAAMFDLSGWDSAVGIQNWSGSSVNATGTPEVLGTPGIIVCNPACAGTLPIAAIPGTFGLVSTKATAIDGQMQGAIGSMPVGIYVSYARAPAVSAVIGGTFGNAYNPGTLTRSSLNVSGELGVIPGIATLGAAIRRANSGVADNGGANATDNAIMMSVTYMLAQNMMLSLSHTSNSGSYWTQTNIDAIGSKATTINLSTLF